MKIIGKTEYTNNATGEIEVMNGISVEKGDFNFHKLWLKNILSAVDSLGNLKIKLAFWIVENLNSENQFIGTYRKIAQYLEVSVETVKRTINSLDKFGNLKM